MSHDIGVNDAKVNRYKHDIEQAEEMQKALRKKKGRMSADDVRVGLEGLEKADALGEQGKLEESLEVYGMSIELLLQFLKQGGNVRGADRSVVEARVRSALSEAEKLKQIVRRRSPQQTSPTISGVSAQGSLRSVFGRLTAFSTVNNASVQQPQPQQRQQPSRSSCERNVASKAVNKSSGQTRKRNDTKPSPSTSPINHTNTQRRRTSLDYDNDPLVKTVKQDLYVDSSELQNTSWNDIAGLQNAKQALQESAILPLMRPDLFTGLRKPQNILLYGPPGTGKTMLVRAAAKESDCLLFACSSSALTSKWHGEGEKLVRTLFKVAHDVAPSIVFVDEMDSLLSSRKSDGEHEASRRFKTEFMVQMDGIGKNSNAQGQVLILGCTNCPWDIDSAVLRRFPRRIYIPLPDDAARRALMEKLLQKAGKHNLTSRQISSVVRKTSGFSCSDISSIAAEAAFGPLRSLGGLDAIRDVQATDIRPISFSDFDNAIGQATKSVSPSLLRRYDEWADQQAASAH